MCSMFCPCQLDHPASQHDVVSPSGFVDVMDCYTDSVTLDPQQVSLAQSLETQHKCAGMCAQSNYYVFSDSSAGKPQQSCAQTTVSTAD